MAYTGKKRYWRNLRIDDLIFRSWSASQLSGFTSILTNSGFNCVRNAKSMNPAAVKPVRPVSSYPANIPAAAGLPKRTSCSPQTLAYPVLAY